MMPVIVVQNVEKSYKQYTSKFGRLLEWFSPVAIKRHRLLTILKNISFTIGAGEAVALVGLNGAGKSTLLKMIVGTTIPTKGSIQINGRIAALLELGMGFHPEFTGRQNVFMAGPLLGYSNQELHELMPAIESFAEIGDYIDKPVRTYSSGMQMRLAFSLATAKRPEILIVDEALSVGDAYFQHKSFERIRQFRSEGTTLLIVSHDRNAIQSICDRAILLEKGQIAMEGKPEEVLDYYNAKLADDQNQQVKQITLESGKVQTISGTGEATVVDIGLYNEQNELIEVVHVGQKVTLRIEVKVHENLEKLVLGYGIKDRLGQVLYGTNTVHMDKVLASVEKGQQYRYDWSFIMNLGPGTYSVQSALVSTDTHLENNYEWKDGALVFEVLNVDKPYFMGLAWLPPQVKIKQCEETV